MEAKYDSTTPKEVAQKQIHLSQDQRDDLEKLFSKFSKLFSGKLGCYKKKKIHLETKEGSIPKHARPYSVPRTHYDIFKRELQHLTDIGVLRPIDATHWASPTFIVTKKDDRVR